MLEQGKTYKHKNCVDMRMHILTVIDNDLYVVNYCDERGFLYTHMSDVVQITTDKIQDWKEVKI